MTKLIVDKIGFPLAEVPGVGAFHLWPVTKYQFEQFMSETNRYGDKWYEPILSLNKRISFKYFSEGNYEKLFLTGILPGEAMDFARWLGDNFDLPTEEEWKIFYRFINNQADISFPNGLSIPALTIGQKLAKFLHTPKELSLLQGGVLEWVKGTGGHKGGSEYVGRGVPRSSFYQSAWSPLDPSIKGINTKERVYFFGFRLIYRRAPEVQSDDDYH
ncbi:MAG: SUMF1/EgtB/PvdO family nonheme iron enzyme [Candidatus Aminicenantes bacterium]|nr:SUMF1/EgtB/PvdO family nonheme iron enzyme [Candidatus Aminicenantes bacterium]NIM80544.1 SUMF1/EgtB/PvdO family nonheme iron enzyme [Candidatus Aminicenantes bacterium]NIN19925.1 SUMF1/EgtB/PvdO family nonheme iron enzyme [Candidatus Aminicenantes bacterium]NIN43773.1 SUMF1/EgtB/PvdO family nonheme iron enzyme [Candidatus Aminicenantes bacterium]NIN86551.1 SUMF1/EgtB/PvdO family nonheme iron enzyme [Candidatus Aminicenantes bacterium]